MDKKTLLAWVENLQEGATITMCSYHGDDCLCATNAEDKTIAKLTHLEMGQECEDDK